MAKVRVARIGVGKCASSFVQGVKYYKSKGVEPNMDTIRKNIAANKGKFKATG